MDLNFKLGFRNKLKAKIKPHRELIGLYNMYTGLLTTFSGNFLKKVQIILKSLKLVDKIHQKDKDGYFIF
ncbi:hypothetical protein [Wolbachia endosymbiont of Folsomia candida]|uniref:hypothetical protein n=1 Tax=Wolbachia endosymbiont of Folsomia candida TaxID=169402 RepID=UPI000A4D7B23|nr:hypothetical protein [Wolbachia endosymbiont of Folsomia candida]APR98570.1 hypothetical protein ASM33_04935 [Wolbachia endosymbiont of Folsomia candida]